MIEIVVDTITERQVGLDNVTKIVNVLLRRLASTHTLCRAKLWAQRSASDVKSSQTGRSTTHILVREGSQ